MMDLGALLRDGTSDDGIKDAIMRAVLSKPEKHEFSDGKTSSERKKMWQIGG
jgi:molybdenum cofactor biosynthesis enzyme MoaA